jgi:hypothetical protein
MADSDGPTEGERIAHETYKDWANGMIPFNLNTTTADDLADKIRCPRCEKRSEEIRFEWVGTDVYYGEIGADGTALYHDLQSVTLACPECDEYFTAY